MVMSLALSGWGVVPLIVTLILVTMRELDNLRGTPRSATYRWIMGIGLGIFAVLSVAEVIVQVTAYR